MAQEISLEFERSLVELEKKIDELKHFTHGKSMNMSEEIEQLEQKAESLRQEIYTNLTPWQIIQISRHPLRPHTLDYIHGCFEDFLEMHGDRAFIDDRAMVGGVAWLDGRPVMVVGTQKGKDTKENLVHNFGLPLPEGYRKALRLMKFAEKFSMPIITFVDTAGAFPGLEGEERGVAEAIARNLREMSQLTVPVIVVIIGEGGSGGALGIGVGNRVLMLSHASYTVITPEGCAAILWKDRAEAPKASEILKITARDLIELKVIDDIIEEPFGGAHRDRQATLEKVKAAIKRHLAELEAMDEDALLEQRYQKFRSIGQYETVMPTPPPTQASDSDVGEVEQPGHVSGK